MLKLLTKALAVNFASSTTQLLILREEDFSDEIDSFEVGLHVCLQVLDGSWTERSPSVSGSMLIQLDERHLIGADEDCIV